jgi:hypothetical protein
MIKKNPKGKKMKMKQTMLLIFIIILISLRCDTTEPPAKGSLLLTLEDVSCTETWLTLKVTDIPLPTSVVLKQNDIARATINLTNADTLLYLDSLLPKQTYKFQLVIQSIPPEAGRQSTVSSNELSVTTMDTTSHNFTWQTFTFGEHSSSVLYDVAIINENNIWAVGEIYMKDSLGQPDLNAYNAVHWDGQKWELKRIYTYSSCNAVDYAPLKAIWTFSDKNIVVTSGGSIGWFNGITNKPDCSIRPLLTGSINKFWGSSSNDLYAVGDGGNIAHYNGSSWTKIESGTTTNINDVWGIIDPITQEKRIFCAVSYVFEPGDQKILTIRNNKVDSLSWTTGRRIHSIWTKSN